MSQTLQNQLLIAKSMNGIISFDDGAGTIISNGEIITNDLNSINTNTTNMTLQNLNMTGSFEVPDVNDITTSYGLVSFANYGQTYLAKNLYLSAGYLLPYFPLSTTSYRLGLNSMQYMTAATINSIAIGLNTMKGTTSGLFNQMPQSVVIGNNAFSTPNVAPTSVGISLNNVIIGDNAAKSTTSNKDCVLIGGQISSTSNIGSNSNSVVIGANIGSLANSFGAGYNDSIVIGSNLLLKPGVNSGIVIGANAFKNSTFNFANGPCVVGYNSCLNVGNFNRLTVFGNEACKNISQNAFNMGIGPECGNSMVSNIYCMCFGAFADVGNTLKNSTAFGVNCVTSESNTFKVGGQDGTFTGLGYDRTQDLLISKKNRLLCGYFETNATVNLTFEQPEYYFINAPNPTVINLPTPASATTSTQNVTNFGARFIIVRTVAGANQNITINPPSAQFIYFNGVASSSYIFSSNESYVELVCCNNGTGNSSWAVSSSQQVATGGFSTGLSTNTISPYVAANQCDLWTGSTATTINIGRQSSAQIINFSKINTNSIEPKTVGSDINMFTTTIASFLNFGNSGDYIDANFYVNPKFFGAVNFNNVQPLNLTGIPTSAITNYGTFTGGITASATQTINFGANAPTMRGDNIVANSIGQTQIDSGYLDLFSNQTIPFGTKTFTHPPVMSGASIGAGTIPYASLAPDYRIPRAINSYSLVAGTYPLALTTGDVNTFYGLGAGESTTTGGANCYFGTNTGRRNTALSNNNTGFGSGAMGYVPVGTQCNSNTAIGSTCMQFITTGGFNTSVGSAGMQSLTTGSYNNFIGVSAGNSIITGNYNSGIGDNSFASSTLRDANNCTFLGANTDLTTTGLTNITCVGYGTTCGVSNTIQLGSNSEIVAISGVLKSGANTISTANLGYLAGVSTGIVDLSSNQTIGGIKKYLTAPILGSQSLTTVPTSTLSLSGGREVYLSAAGITSVILPTPTAADIGKTFVLIRDGITFPNSYVLGPAVPTDKVLVDGVVQSNYQTSYSQPSITVTALATSGNTYILHSFNNVNGLFLSKNIYPLTSGGSLPSNSNFTTITTISMGTDCCLANTNSNLHTQNATIIGSNACKAMTLNPPSMTVVGSGAFLLLNKLSTNTTAIGASAGALYSNAGGINNTLLGATTDFASNAAYTNSTAVGYGSLISASNVVVLGRTTETTVIPSASIQYGSSYRPNSVFRTINSTPVDWRSTGSPPTNFPKYIMFSGTGTTVYILTLPLIDNANIFEGMEFIFRRTDTTATPSTTSILQCQRAGTDQIYLAGSMTKGTAQNVLGSNVYQGKLVVVDKANGFWAYFPS